MRILLLLLLSVTSFAQIQVIPSASRPRATTPVVSNIQEVDLTYSHAQYTDETITVAANPNGASVTSWLWQLIGPITKDSNGTVVATSTAEDPAFAGVTTIGFYDIHLKAENSTDSYVRDIRRAIYIFKPKVAEGSADRVINLASGSYFEDFSGEDWSDKVIFIKGTNANAYIELLNLRGSVDHPVYIYKADDNTQVQYSFSGGAGRPFWLSGYQDFIGGEQGGCRYVVINGYNADGTHGIKITGGATTNSVISGQGKFTDIMIAGVEVVHQLTVNGPAVTLVPTVGSSCNIDNWLEDNLVIYNLKITGAGEEGIYINESSQDPDYIGNNGFVPPMCTGSISWNVIDGSGRDAIQPGGFLGEVHDNIAYDWGQQKDAAHESCICHNSGSAIVYSRNKCIGGKMLINMASGLINYDKLGGETVPRSTIFIGNQFSSGTYDHTGGGTEPYAIVCQNNPESGAGTWNVAFFNNEFDTDLKLMQCTWALGGFFSNKFTMANNIIVKVGDAGDWDEVDFTGNGAGSPTGTVVNNIVRERGSDLSDLFFADYDAFDYEITSFLSAAYLGTPTAFTSYSEFSTYFKDYYGYPLTVPVYGRNFGSYSGYGKRLVTP